MNNRLIERAVELAVFLSLTIAAFLAGALIFEIVRIFF